MKNLLRFWKPLLWILALSLVGWTFWRFPFVEAGKIVAQIAGWKLIVVLAVNAGIVILMGLRWRLVLSAQGFSVPLLAITRYRLAAFSVSYFTPGPQFGGEPLQVYYLKKNHGVSTDIALASVGFDKALDLIANFSFLAFGITSVVVGQKLAVENVGLVLLLPFGMLAAPLVYILAIQRGMKPGYMIGEKTIGRASWWPKIGRVIKSAEEHIAALFDNDRKILTLALLVSGLVWVALIMEYWLMLAFIGLEMNFWEVIAVMTAARIAFLTPLPGGLGVLEAGQALAVGALGYDPLMGASLGLLIRGRDVLFGAIGIVWGRGSKKEIDHVYQS